MIAEDEHKPPPKEDEHPKPEKPEKPEHESE